MQVLHRLPQVEDARLLVGAATADDAGVFQIDRSRALVQTVDFFTPIVDDPFLYGQIAAANSLSDVYAMGGRPLTALNLMGVPADILSPRTIRAILRGGAQKAREAGCILVGGHTIRNPEPFYGLSVTGLVHPKRLITNANARPGDLLLLTKPLGTGIITTGIKRGLASAALARKAVAVMSQLNAVGATLAERGLVIGGTDITGYGLLGHLGSMCRASGIGAEIHSSAVPVVDRSVATLIEQECIPGGTKENLRTANEFTEWEDVSRKFLLADAQTSGGLLLCVKPSRIEKVLSILKDHGTRCAAVIGRIIRSSQPRIWVRS